MAKCGSITAQPGHGVVVYRCSCGVSVCVYVSSPYARRQIAAFLDAHERKRL